MFYKKRRERRRDILKKRSKFLMLLSFSLKCLFSLFFVAIFVVSLYLFSLLKGIPQLDLNKFNNYEQVSYVFDRNGNSIAMLEGTEKRIYATYDELPENLVNAFKAIEDKRFDTHKGIDARGVINALYGEFISSEEGRGGSTITQQLVKNTFLTSERSYQRKLQEMVLAIELENELPKEKIFEYYVNDIFMGEDNYGVKAAALDYFGKNLDELSLKEMAAIAGITAYPNGYNPRSDYESCSERADLVLREMFMDGMITQQECTDALNEKLVVTDEYFNNGVYSHAAFIDLVIEEVADDLLEAQGMEKTPLNISRMKHKVRTGGYYIYTTIDTEKQDEIQNLAANFSYATAEAECSGVFIDHHNGEILVLISGREDNTVLDGFNRAVNSLQPIGSSAKPIFVYAPYIENGANTDTLVDDTRTKIPGYNTEQGYPNGITTGEMITLRYAIETSRNVAAVKTLAKLGTDKAFEYMVKMGINPEHSSQSLNGIALGSDGYSTLEIAGAYATLANDGVYIEPHAYTRVTDFDGTTIIRADNHIRTERVFSSETAYMISDILHTTVLRGYSVGAQALGITSGNKTGTHEDRAVTSGGFTHYNTGFIRISRDDYGPIKETSYNHAVRMWTEMMKVMNSGLENAPLQDADLADLKIYYSGSEIHHRQSAG